MLFLILSHLSIHLPIIKKKIVSQGKKEADYILQLPLYHSGDLITKQKKTHNFYCFSWYVLIPISHFYDSVFLSNSQNHTVNYHKWFCCISLNLFGINSIQGNFLACFIYLLTLCFSSLYSFHFHGQDSNHISYFI